MLVRGGYGGLRFKRPAFVLNTRAVGLGVSRSLALKGVPVVAVDFRKQASKMQSRSFASYHEIPDIDSAPDAAADALLEIQSKWGEKGVLFPTSDAFILFVSRYRRKLSAQFDMAIPAEEVLEGIMNKRTQYETASRLGIPIPETHYPASLSDLDSFKDSIGYPLLIKPHYSHKWQQVYDNKGFQVFGPKELAERFEAVIQRSPGTEVMVQKVVTGPISALLGVRAYVDRRGQAHGVIGAQKLRQYPVDFGIGTMVQTTHCEEVKELGLRFMKGLGFRGIGSVEFKRDPESGSFKLMEINARSVKNNYMATKAGVNLPWLMYQDMTGMPMDEDSVYADGVRWHDFVMDCRAYMTLRFRKEITFKEWMRTSLGADCHPYFDWNDLKPSLVKTRWGFDPLNEIFYVSLAGLGRLLRRS